MAASKKGSKPELIVGPDELEEAVSAEEQVAEVWDVAIIGQAIIKLESMLAAIPMKRGREPSCDLR